jgi:hypothetical protein
MKLRGHVSQSCWKCKGTGYRWSPNQKCRKCARFFCFACKGSGFVDCEAKL